MEKVDIVILSNGPGELITWVRPVVQQLRQQANIDMRISVILSPCPHATGKEVAIARSYPEVDRVQPAEYFWQFLLMGKTAENWHWYPQGVVLFLGGDQFFTVMVGKRLGYRTVIYAEWDARWWRWIDKFGVMKQEVVAQVPPKYADKFTVVGDLMNEVRSRRGEWPLATHNFPTECSAFMSALSRNVLYVAQRNARTEVGSCFSDGESSNEVRIQNSEILLSNGGSNLELIGLLPGSKPTKLSLGVPLTLAIAQHIHKIRPQTRFIIPVAPTLELETLANFADPQKNPAIAKMGGVGAKLLIPSLERNETENTEQAAGLETALTQKPGLLRTHFKDNDQGNKPSFLVASGNSYEIKNPKLVTTEGVEIELITRTPAYDLLSQCRLCLTTVGANTAELGSLAVPMIVLLPTQQLDIMRAWDGLPGLLANLPGVGAAFATIINWLVVRKGQLFAWPNIWAKEEIVPELMGKLKPETVAELVLEFLSHPEKLVEMSDRLRSLRGEPGAAEKLAEIVLSLT
ncbi:lipid-A-disaccharide synthase [Hydrocoleum sp. CS-953]|uniref:lipid-A-disaccharide synthase n=1 Tax=Hydrocoleum sp. CS-953 TaxID=1671698 RepID=UPI000B9B6EB7|nr:lipid-A-disaccharide synthase [Hydrocoleum sp. CS-953]OZH51599.1 lipid-A-disaccharide synthase [Hydrocoleum sp. CS-953]